MISSEIFAAVVSIIAILFAVYAIVKANQAGVAVTPQLVTNSLKTATTAATELTEVALTAAQASEQLYRTGKIERGERLDHAFAYVKKFFPDLDKEIIVTAIEAGVLVVNTLVDAIPVRRAGGP